MFPFFRNFLRKTKINEHEFNNLDSYSVEDIDNIVKVQCLYRIKKAKNIFRKRWKETEKPEHCIENKFEPMCESIYTIGELILVKNDDGAIARKIIKNINNFSEIIETTDNIKYSFNDISESYFDEDFMKLQCPKPAGLKNFKIKKMSFYGIKIALNKTFYVNINMEKQYYFGPFQCLEYSLLYHDWIKFNWLISSNQWLKNDKKQYSNWGFILDKIEKNESGHKIKNMFYEFYHYFNKYLDISKPEPKTAPKKYKRKTIVDSKKRKKRKKIKKITKKDIIYDPNICNIKQKPKRPREKQLSLSKHSELFRIQDNKCALCYEKINVDQWDWEVDHCIPWYLNGGHCINNFQIVHKKCHKIKSRLIDNKFKEFINNNIEYKDAKLYCKCLFDKYNKELESKKQIFAQAGTLSPELIF